jgi:hypothetical protein
MALEKIIKEDKIEIVGDYKVVQIRTATVIMEDGVELSSSFHRHVVSPGDDLSEQSSEVQAICNTVHTPEVIAAWEAHQQEQSINIASSDDTDSGE